MDLVGFLNYMEEIGLFNHPDDSFKVKEWKAKVQEFDGDYNEEFELKKDLINTFGPRLLEKDFLVKNRRTDFPPFQSRRFLTLDENRKSE